MAASDSLGSLQAWAPAVGVDPFLLSELLFVRDVMNHWFTDTAGVLAGARGILGGFPRNYIVIDVETTGLDFATNLVCQLGWAVVRNGQLADCNAAMLDWTRHPAVEQGWLRRSLDEVRGYFERKGNTFHFPYERLREEGGEPEEVLRFAADVLEDHISHGELTVGHNAWFFDRQMLDANVRRFLGGRTIPWQPNSIFDTGLVEKAAQINRPPYANETLDGWFRRVHATRSRVAWNLENHCVCKYRLNERHPVEAGMAHDAGYDCKVTHWLFEAFGELMQSNDI